jgi:hypothetical protein
MLNRTALGLLCLMGLSALGCTKETTSSQNIKTPGIAALIDVYADTDDTATVHVKLVVAGKSSNAYVTLDGSDKLTATANGKTKTLSVVDTGIYEAKLTGVGADTEINVTLDRPDDATASDNTGLLPAPFTLDEPPSNLSRADDPLDVTWAPSDSGDPMTLIFDGDCVFTASEKASDTGTFTVDKGTLKSTDSDKPKTCDVNLEVDRKRVGSADPQFDPDSYFHLSQRRTSSFTSKP